LEVKERICGGSSFWIPLQWWDHKSKKVTEHQSCQSSHVNEAISFVNVNLFALFWLLSCHGLNFVINFFKSFALVGLYWDRNNRLEKVINATCCVNLLLMVKVSMVFLYSYDNIYAWDVENTRLTSLISGCR
jgi:hypothetical protein